MSEEQAKLDLGDTPSTLIAMGKCYQEMVNEIMGLIMKITDNNPALSHAIAASAEARLRALNHYNLVTNIINAQAAEKQNEEKP